MSFGGRHRTNDDEWRGLKSRRDWSCWKKLAERIEEEVLDKYKVEDSAGMEACA